MSFASDLSELCKRAGDRAEVVIRATALELQAGMIERSPVDTGRFKSNWQVGIGAINKATGDAPGSDAKGRAAAALSGWTAGRSIYLSNSLPYAKRLEDGWSQKQAPLGMVRLTVQAYADALNKAIREAK
jgi:hypothetical protein